MASWSRWDGQEPWVWVLVAATAVACESPVRPGPQASAALGSPLPERASTAAGAPPRAPLGEVASAPSAEPPAPEPPPAAPAPPEPPPITPPEPPPVPVAPEAPPLLDESGALLPQTEEVPRIDTPLFQHRLGLLWRAIVEDDPEIARPFFFPKVAYLKVKAIKDPAQDWEKRLWRLFVRDVHEYHQALGPKPHEARFVRLDFPEGRSAWMKKHKEGNAIGYHRVKRPYLVFTDAGGKERKLEVTVMISWRGEWYVVHLHGFS